ncbi:MAG: hypothetical protein ACKVQK_26120 [Burkholderiales bacterium]
MKTNFSIAAASITLVATTFLGFAAAQHYPNRPVKVIVPYPPGGQPDIAVRLLAQAEQMRIDLNKYTRIVKNANIKPE